LRIEPHPVPPGRLYGRQSLGRRDSANRDQDRVGKLGLADSFVGNGRVVRQPLQVLEESA
jgi:hypothetical protein